MPALLVLTAWVAILSPVWIGATVDSACAEQTKKQQSETSSTDGQGFKLIRMRDGWSKDGTTIHSLELVGPDGKKVFTYFTGFDSPQRASNELQLIVKTQTTILQRGNKFSNDGRKVGERILGIFQNPADPKKTIVRLIWTEDATLHEIRSESQEDVLAAEKLLKR
ncbi:MAG TPA: hypothetical protein VOA88_01190 [Candidatus Dormibacteraeota bacterium]|nr:hypothetical protein [Candidatus Dormibacteraeota bacterium]